MTKHLSQVIVVRFYKTSVLGLNDVLNLRYDVVWKFTEVIRVHLFAHKCSSKGETSLSLHVQYMMFDTTQVSLSLSKNENK